MVAVGTSQRAGSSSVCPRTHASLDGRAAKKKLRPGASVCLGRSCWFRKRARARGRARNPTRAATRRRRVAASSHELHSQADSNLTTNPAAPLRAAAGALRRADTQMQTDTFVPPRVIRQTVRSSVPLCMTMQESKPSPRGKAEVMGNTGGSAALFRRAI